MSFRLIVLFILLSISLVGFNITLTSSTAGDSISTAINLPLNTLTTGSLSGPGSNMYYNVTIPSPGLYSFNLTASLSTDFDLYIYNSSNSLIGYSATSSYPETWIATIPSGVYIIKINSFLGAGSFYVCVAPYTIHPGEDLAHAISLPLNTTVTGSIPYNYYFNISLPTSGYYQFNLTANSSTDFYFNIYTSNGYQLLSSNSVSTSASYYPQQSISALSAGNYYIEIFSFSSTGPFNMTVCPYAIHPGEDLPHALPLLVNSTVTGQVPFNFYYNLTISNTGYYQFNMTNGSSISNFDYALYNSSGSFINGPSYSNTLYQLIDNLLPGNYYLEIEPYGEAGPFNLSFYSYSMHAGEDLAHALTLPQNQTITASMPYNSFFNFSISTPGYYKFNLTTNPTNNFFFYIYDNSGNYIGSNTNSGYPEIADLDLLTGTYYVWVSSSYGVGNFTLTLVPYTYPGIDLAHAVMLSQNQTFTGILPFDSFFNITIVNQARYTILLNTDYPNNYYFFDLYSSNGTFIGGAGISPNIYPLEYDPVLAIGTYYIEVSDLAGSDPFNITFSSYIYPPGCDLAHAISLASNTTLSGDLTINDWFNITISKNADYLFNLQVPEYYYVVMSIYSSSGTELSSQDSSSQPIVSLSIGDYSILITSESGSGLFNISYSQFTPFSSQASSGSQTSTSTTTSTSTSTSNLLHSSSEINTSIRTTPFSSFSLIFLACIVSSGIVLFKRKIIK